MKKSGDSSKDSQKVQGEGDYLAAERYGKSVRTFVQSGKVHDAAQKAKPLTPGDEEELKRAERAGIAHSKGEDPVSPRAPARKP